VPASGPAGRSWGWHRLTTEWAARVVADAGVRRGELVIDVGAGDGALTEHLLGAGARVIAVELHAGRAEQLRRRFVDAPVSVVQVDLASFRWPARPFRVVANPPYAATTMLIGGLLARGSSLVAADLVLQRPAVRHIVDGSRGPRHWRRTYSLVQGATLPRRAFHPPPRVDSAVLVVRRRRHAR
jgi:23S rRNA (adenine-N6)-dimethyltransferase